MIGRRYSFGLFFSEIEGKNAEAILRKVSSDFESKKTSTEEYFHFSFDETAWSPDGGEEFFLWADNHGVSFACRAGCEGRGEKLIFDQLKKISNKSSIFIQSDFNGFGNLDRLENVEVFIRLLWEWDVRIW